VIERNNLSESFWQPGEHITLRGVWDKVFWAYPTIVVQDTPDLVVLYMPAGVLGKNTDHRLVPKDFFCPEEINIVDNQWVRTDVLMIIVPNEPFSVYAMWKAGTKDLICWYINLQEPIRRTQIGFDTMDHMLDIVVNPEMTEWNWKDEDEIVEAERLGLYSQEKVRKIWADGENAVNLLISERQSAYKKWETWRRNLEWETPSLSPMWDVGYLKLCDTY